jgi:hypothetical protein
MDQKTMLQIIGELYLRLYQLDQENANLKAAIRNKDEELGLLKHGQDTQRVSGK